MYIGNHCQTQACTDTGQDEDYGQKRTINTGTDGTKLVHAYTTGNDDVRKFVTSNKVSQEAFAKHITMGVIVDTGECLHHGISETKKSIFAHCNLIG